MTQSAITLHRRRFLGTAAAGLALPFVVAPSGPSFGAAPLRVRASRDIQVLDPGYLVGGAEHTVDFATLGQLGAYAPGDRWDWQPSPLVESLELVDGKDFRFRLRPGFAWSGGFGDVTADDVKFSFERLKDTDWKDSVRALDRVDVTGTYEGVVVLKHPFAPFALTFLCDGVGSIVSRKAIEAAGGRYTTEPPASFGPYAIASWLPKQRLELAANPAWQGAAPAFASVHILPIEEDKTAELAFEAGELDITEISSDSVVALRDNLPAGTALLTVPAVRYSWLGLNTEHPKLADVRVRRAIQHAVDVDSINAGAYAGVAPRARGVVPPGLVGHRTSSPFEKRDVDKAKALLQEAGVSGITLNLHTLNIQARTAAAQIIQANLAEIGIQVEIVPVDSGVFWNLGQESQGEEWRDLQLWIMEYDGRPDASFCLQWFVSSQVGVWNWERWKSDEFDRLYDEGLAESDPAKRDAIYVRLQEIMDDTGGYVWINHQPQSFIHRTSIRPAVLLHGRHYFQRYEPA